MMIITAIETAMQTITADTRKMIDAMYAVSAPDSKISLEYTWIGSLVCPLIFPQTTACIANRHIMPLVGTSVQMTVVWLVVVGQLPQFDARML